MAVFELNGIEYAKMVEMGAKSLVSDIDRINALNVFPVPDGDTGTNMRMTIEGGVEEGLNLNNPSIGATSKAMARAMTLNARGNSGVITSQYFRGIGQGLADIDIATVKQFGEALVSGTNRAYKVVQNPTEGTILTVVREAGEYALANYHDGMDLVEYLENYLKQARETLANTPELLPVLKKAGVVDSGGAGLVLIIEGFIKYLNGEDIILDAEDDDSVFGVNSKLAYGYSMEFELQLQNSKTDVENFNLNDFNYNLKGLSTELETAKHGTIISVRLNTFHPGSVICLVRKLGEFLTIKIDNMDVEDTETIKRERESIHAFIPEHKAYATVAVASGAGLVQAFRSMGVDEVVSGGQTMNTSTQDFIRAFESLNADNILVFPNNGNIIMAAEQAAANYEKAHIIVIPTKTIAQGYSACSMLNFDSNNTDEIVANLKEVIANVSTLEITYSIRDTEINGLKIKKGDYICLYNGDLIASDSKRMSAIKAAFRAIPDFHEKNVLTVICGIDSKVQETAEIEEIAQAYNSYMEVYPVEGEQDIYCYIIGIE